jgi:signal peptidase I
MNKYYPLCAFENLQIEEAGVEVIVFDTKTKTFHVLNTTAHGILKACNGLNTIEDIAATIASDFEIEDLDSVVADVTETIKSFESKGLLWFVADEAQLSTVETDHLTASPLLTVTVDGISMFPILLSNDKVLVKRNSLEDLNIGDIIVWLDRSQKYVAHRIVSIDTSSTPAQITTKGDVHFEPDSPVRIDRVLGKVVAVMHEGQPRWIKEHESSPDQVHQTHSPETDQQTRRPSYKGLQVLDLREVSVESIQNIESVEEVGLVLLSPENAHAWSSVAATKVWSTYVAPKEYRVYTGQPELLPEMLEFLAEPLRLIVSGQLFLTSFEPQQILEAFKELIVLGGVYVSSIEAKSAVESFANIVAGGIAIVPAEHVRWIGESILGPENVSGVHQVPLVACGNLAVSARLGEIPNGLAVYR